MTRNEFDPAFSAQEDYQPGVSGISMQLWKTHKDADGNPLVTPARAPFSRYQRRRQWRLHACRHLRGTNAVTDAGSDLQAVRLLRDRELDSGRRTARPSTSTATRSTGEMALPDHPAKVDYSTTPTPHRS